MSMLALKPPMGWNSWNTFSWRINEALIKETADYIVDNGFRDAGYNVISIDDCWMMRERDENGRLVPDPVKFPNGLKVIGDYLHERGLKFGLYEDGGTLTCAGFPGSFGHEREDAKQFAEWGVDLLKYDFCYPAPGCSDVNMFRRMGQALRETGRDIIFSGCWCVDGVWKWMRSCGVHMWRMAGDIMDSWESITKVGFGAVGYEAYAGPSGWNDLDMMVVGVNGEGHVGEMGGGCSINEYQAHFALWCLMSTPLLMGHDVRKTTPEIKAILQNTELIAINQDDAAIPAYRVPVIRNYYDILAKPLANGDIAFGLFNREDNDKNIPLAWDYCGWEVTDSVKLRDLISHEDIGTFRSNKTFRLPPHSCRVFRATRV